MHVAVYGVGATGARAVRQLIATPAVTRVVVADGNAERGQEVVASMADGSRATSVAADGRWWDGADAAILAHTEGDHAERARHLLDEGISVVSTSAAPGDVRALLALDEHARERQRTVVVGAGFSPGLSCLLVAQGAGRFDVVDEVHVARSGWGGLACAEGFFKAVAGAEADWRDGRWASPPGGGRQLCWFPEPVGARDVARAATADPLVLVPAFPGVAQVTSRLALSARERLSRRLSRPKLGTDGSFGAIRVEVRGRQGGRFDQVVLGAVDRPAVAAGAVAALSAVAVSEGKVARSGSGGLAELAMGSAMLAELARRGVKGAVFEGTEPAALV